jgi:hypothetical protein
MTRIVGCAAHSSATSASSCSASTAATSVPRSAAISPRSRRTIALRRGFAEASRTRSPSSSGSSGNACPSSSPAPQNTAQPRLAASARAVPTSADLPIPGSPSISTEPPRPAATALTSPARVASSFWRPISERIPAGSGIAAGLDAWRAMAEGRPRALASNAARVSPTSPSAPASKRAVSRRAVRLTPRSRSLTARVLRPADSASCRCVSPAPARSCLRRSPNDKPARCSATPLPLPGTHQRPAADAIRFASKPTHSDYWHIWVRNGRYRGFPLP